MSPVPDTILHQTDVQAVIDAAISADRSSQTTQLATTYAKRGVAVIATPTAPGAAYVQAEMTSLKTAIDAIRAALSASGVTS